MLEPAYVAIVLLVLVVLSFAAVSRRLPAEKREDQAYDQSEIGLVQQVPVYTSCEQPFMPVGTLTGDDSRVLQLLGRPSHLHRDRWFYMTLVDQHQIPVELNYNGRPCRPNTIGCEQVQSGDMMSSNSLTSAPMRVQMYGE